jgi:hypothetical protein
MHLMRHARCGPIHSAPVFGWVIGLLRCPAATTHAAEKLPVPFGVPRPDPTNDVPCAAPSILAGNVILPR